MPQTYTAYVPRKRLPSVEELVRAMCSRGFKVQIETEQPLDQLEGALPITIDGNSPSINLDSAPLKGSGGSELEGRQGELEAQQSQGDERADKLLKVLKTTDIRFDFKGGDEDGDAWARDTARTLALLSCGAFENPQQDSILHYGY